MKHSGEGALSSQKWEILIDTSKQKIKTCVSIRSMMNIHVSIMFKFMSFPKLVLWHMSLFVLRRRHVGSLRFRTLPWQVFSSHQIRAGAVLVTRSVAQTNVLRWRFTKRLRYWTEIREKGNRILKHVYVQGIYLDIGPNCIAMQKCTWDLTPTTASAVIWGVWNTHNSWTS